MIEMLLKIESPDRRAKQQFLATEVISRSEEYSRGWDDPH